jgi:hypothetical protein
MVRIERRLWAPWLDLVDGGTARPDQATGARLGAQRLRSEAAPTRAQRCWRHRRSPHAMARVVPLVGRPPPSSARPAAAACSWPVVRFSIVTRQAFVLSPRRRNRDEGGGEPEGEQQQGQSFHGVLPVRFDRRTVRSRSCETLGLFFRRPEFPGRLPSRAGPASRSTSDRGPTAPPGAPRPLVPGVPGTCQAPGHSPVALATLVWLQAAWGSALVFRGHVVAATVTEERHGPSDVRRSRADRARAAVSRAGSRSRRRPGQPVAPERRYAGGRGCGGCGPPVSARA